MRSQQHCVELIATISKGSNIIFILLRFKGQTEYLVHPKWISRKTKMDKAIDKNGYTAKTDKAKDKNQKRIRRNTKIDVGERKK